MAITRQGTAAVTNAASALSITANLPTGITTGELIVLWAVGKGFNASNPVATGYTARGRFTSQAMDIALFYRVADGSEGSTVVVDNTGAGNSTTWATIAVRYSGVDTTTPFAATDVTQNGATADTSTDDTDLIVTTTAANAMVIACIGIDDPAGTNRVPDIQTAGLSEVGQNLTNMVAEADDGVQAVAGASSEIYWTWTTSDTFSAYATALNPAAAGGAGFGSLLARSRNRLVVTA